MIKLTSRINQGSWKDFREAFNKFNPCLTKIIDQIDPSDKYKIYQIDYHYGDLIAKNGKLNLAVGDGGEKTSALEAIHDDLSYATFPLAMQGNNCSEIVVENPGSIFSLNIFNAGDLFGLFEALSYVNNLFEFPSEWNVYAGVTSVCLLGKINNAIKYRKLALKYRLDISPPNGLLEQRKTIQSIGNNSDWHCSVFFFGKNWLEKLRGGQWVSLLNYLYSVSWRQSGGSRNERRTGEFWHNDYYPLDTNILFAHIIMISFGYYPGMKIINNYDNFLPARFIEKAFIEVYGLGYAPIIMGTAFLGKNTKQTTDCVYYSSAFNIIQSAESKRTIANLSPKEFMRLESLIRNTTIFKASKNRNTKHRIGEFDSTYFANIGYTHVHLRMFHSSNTASDGSLFYNGNDLVHFDDEANALLNGRFKGLTFPSLNIFFHSCVQISAGVNG